MKSTINNRPGAVQTPTYPGKVISSSPEPGPGRLTGPVRDALKGCEDPRNEGGTYPSAPPSKQGGQQR